MEAFSALLVLCAGNSQVTGEFPSQRPVTRSFDIFFDRRLSKQSVDLRRHGTHYDVTVMCPECVDECVHEHMFSECKRSSVIKLMIICLSLTRKCHLLHFRHREASDENFFKTSFPFQCSSNTFKRNGVCRLYFLMPFLIIPVYFDSRLKADSEGSTDHKSVLV